MPNALSNFSLKRLIDNLVKDEDGRRKVGQEAINAIQRRFSAGLDTSDGSAPPYSPHGPVYLSLAHNAKAAALGNKHLRGTGFRYSLSHRQARNLQNLHSEQRSIIKGFFGDVGETTEKHWELANVARFLSFIREGKRGSDTSGSGTTSRTGNSMRFDDYRALKEFLGHPGYRDLQLTGAMRAAITITAVSQDQVRIGYLDEEQEAKARGNEKWAKMWGFSPNDQSAIRELWEQLVTKKARQIFR